MVKIFSGITLLAAAAAIFFGLQSKGMIEKLQVAAEREHNDVTTERNKVKKVEKELTEAKAEVTAAKDEVEKLKEPLAKAEAEAKKAVADLTAATEAKTAAETQAATMKKTYDDFVEQFKGQKPEDILKKVADMEQASKDIAGKIAPLENEVASQKIVIEDLSRQKKNAEDKVAGKDKTIERYTKNIMEKGTRGRVLAVNSGWGFCVISIGDRKGAAANKVLIVARGGQAIGKVRITSVEANQSVADILPMSFVRGTYVEPGDEIIFTGEDKPREETAAAGAPAPATGVPASPMGLPALPQH